MKIIIINGPNLNLLGKREQDIYGTRTFGDIMGELQNRYADIQIDYYQSNIEGELIDKVQRSEGIYDGIIINAGGYTHTSVALGDAVGAADLPVVEVHVSNILARESYRQLSFLAKHCQGTISGFGTDVYRLGVEALKFYLRK